MLLKLPGNKSVRLEIFAKEAEQPYSLQRPSKTFTSNRSRLVTGTVPSKETGRVLLLSLSVMFLEDVLFLEPSKLLGMLSKTRGILRTVLLSIHFGPYFCSVAAV